MGFDVAIVVLMISQFCLLWYKIGRVEGIVNGFCKKSKRR